MILHISEQLVENLEAANHTAMLRTTFTAEDDVAPKANSAKLRNSGTESATLRK